MSLIVTRGNPTNWVAGNLLTATQINTVDQNPITVAEYVESQRIDVKLYGALGDNSTDDSAAIQAAHDAAVTAGVPLWFPPGLYRFNSIVWGNCSLMGIPNKSKCRCNSTSAPLFTSTADHGVDATAYTAKKVTGLNCDFVTTSSTGELFHVSGDVRIVFDTCDFDSDGSSASGIGAVSLGSSSDTTKAVFRNCSFDLTGDNDLAVGYIAGSTTHVTMTDCRIVLDASARAAAFSLVNGVVIKVENCYIDLSSSTAAATYINIFGGSSTDEVTVTGTTVTAPSSGIAKIFTAGAGGHIVDAANILPEDAVLTSTEPPRWNLASRNRHLDVDQSGGGSLQLDTRNYNFFVVAIQDTTAFSITPLGAPLGTEFDILLFNSAGSPTGVITWDTSYFFDMSTPTAGTGMATQITPGLISSGRFRRCVGSGGLERWYLIGSGVTFP